MPTFTELSEEQRAELWACLALRHAKGMGPRSGKLLIDSFGSARAAVEACLRSPEAWIERSLVPNNLSASFSRQAWREPALEEWRAVKAGAFSLLAYTSPEYPALLREIPDPPLTLYYAGDLSLLRAPTIGVVGARSCSHDGMNTCALLAAGLSRAGVTVVSGMAKGIDRVAHLAGLEGPGKSVGVLGTGIDVVYPRENTDLFRLMREEGLLLAEFPPATPAIPGRFPIRNRIISGLSLGILVVEAAERSGSLITARLAVEQDREVFVVPGHTTNATSAGCRELVRRGAKAVFAPEDILSELVPFLTEHVRHALAESATKQRTGGQARRPAEALHVQMGEDAETLPVGRLPWVAEGGDKPPRSKAAPKSVKKAGQTSAHEAARAIRDTSLPLVQASFHLPEDLPPEDRLLLEALQYGAVHLDDLARRLERDVAELSGRLTMLEIRGLVRRMPGAVYQLPDGGAS